MCESWIVPFGHKCFFSHPSIILFSSRWALFAINLMVSFLSWRLWGIFLHRKDQGIQFVVIQEGSGYVTSQFKVTFLCVRRHSLWNCCVVAKEGYLQCVAVCLWIKATSKKTASSASFHSILVEWRIWHWKVFSICTEESRIHSLPLKSLFLVINIAIHKSIHHGGMCVNINVKIKMDIFIAVKFH